MENGGNLKPWRVRRANETRVLHPQSFSDPVRFLLLVPVYRELDNGNLNRFLARLQPAGAKDSQVTVLFIVNNGAENAQAQDAAFEENQRTIKWIKSEPCAQAKLEVLDLSSAGFEKNMGRLRQAGLDAWGSLFSEVEKNELARTVVVHLDADVSLPNEFFPRLAEAYENFPTIEAVFFQRDFELKGVPSTELLFTHHRYRLRKALFDFTNRRTGLPEGLATYQLSARFFAHEAAGGFPPLARDEDSAFTLRLLQSAWWAQLPDIELTSEDRTRAEGFNSARRAQDLGRLFQGAGPGAKFFRWLRARRSGAFGAIKLARPPRGKDFFLLYGLFVPLAAILNEKVRSGAWPFAKAAEKLRERMESTLGTPVLFGGTSWAEKPLPELPAEATVPGTGGSVLPPLAHPLSATLLMPTLKPGSDLQGILLPHLNEAERNAFAEYLRAFSREHSENVNFRLRGLRELLAGGQTAVGNDPFLAWAAHAPGGVMHIFKFVQQGRISLARAEEELVSLFPEWLSTGPSFAEEASIVKALNRVLAQSYLAANAGELELTLEALGAP